MAVVYSVAFVTALGISAVCALFWALRTGQMNDFRAGALSIFDDDEPAGEVTDNFPVKDSERSGEDLD